MTTIIVDIQNRTIYTDKRTTRSRRKTSVLGLVDTWEREGHIDTTTKIVERGDKIYAGCGDREDIRLFIKHHDAGVNYKVTECKVFVIHKESGEVYLHSPKRTTLWQSVGRLYKLLLWKTDDVSPNTVERLDGDYGWLTAGSGRRWAANYMYAGLNPEDCIRMASLHDQGTSDSYDKMVY
jgi:hypothetical protein